VKRRRSPSWVAAVAITQASHNGMYLARLGSCLHV
jgi:hypothetical protein